jgi:hypothetical protein
MTDSIQPINRVDDVAYCYDAAAHDRAHPAREHSVVKRELDIQAFYAAVESQKSTLGVTWSSLAAELELDSQDVFTSMSRGVVPDANALLTLAAWLGAPLEAFAHGEVVAPDPRQHAMDSISSYLSVNASLAPESQAAIDSVLRAAYKQLQRQQQEQTSDAANTAAHSD